MGRCTRVPPRAQLREAHEGTLNQGEWIGKKARIALYEVPMNYADAGKLYLAIVIKKVSEGRDFELGTDRQGDYVRVYQYTGKHIKSAWAQIEKSKPMLDQETSWPKFGQDWR